MFTAAVVRWGMAPGDFWKLEGQDFFWMAEARKPERTQKWAGSLTDAQVRAHDEALRKHGKQD